MLFRPLTRGLVRPLVRPLVRTSGGPPAVIAPYNITPPVISGAGVAGGTLVGTEGVWGGSASIKTYLWYANDFSLGITTNILDVDSTGLVDGDVVTLWVTATNDAGDASAQSNSITIFIPSGFTALRDNNGDIINDNNGDPIFFPDAP